MSCLEVFFEKAKLVADSNQQIAHIVLPEGEDERIVEGAIKVVEQGLAKITLLGNVDKVSALIAKAGGQPDAFNLIDPNNAASNSSMLARFLELRKGKVSEENAKQAVLETLVFGNLMVEMGEADGSIAGAIHTTGDTVRTAFQIIGKGEGVSSVSSFFLMGLDKERHGRDDTLVFSDCALMIEPDSQQLADIGIASADSFKKMLSIEPQVAMLSFSTKGSAKHNAVTKVEEAVQIANKARPDLAIDGEMQFDAAFIKSVGSSKAPNSKVAGNANVFVFPNLEAGNIGYKIAQRLGGLSATG
ncbi:MAG: phosphate acetyltransferase, partial [Nitratireductor sp.]